MGQNPTHRRDRGTPVTWSWPENGMILAANLTDRRFLVLLNWK